MSEFYVKNRFACHLGAQVAVFLALLIGSRVGGLARAEEDYARNRTALQAVYAGATPPPDQGSVDRIEEESNAIGQVVAHLEARLGWVPSAERSPQRVTQRNDFARAVGDARREVDLAAAGVPVHYPSDLGLGNQTPAEVDLPVALVRLDLVVHVLRAAMKSGLAEFTSIEHKPAETAAEGYVGEVPVRIARSGPSAGVARVLQDLAQSQNFVSVREATLASRAGRDEVDLTIELAALQVHPEKVEGKAVPGGGRPATRETIDDLFGRR